MFRMPEIQRTGDGLPRNFSWVLKDTLGKIQIKLTLNYYMICFTSPAGCAAPASEEELLCLGNHTGGGAVSKHKFTARLGITLLITLSADQPPHPSINKIEGLR